MIFIPNIAPLKPDLFFVLQIVLHYLELIRLRLEHHILYQLLQMLALDLPQYELLKKVEDQV